MQKVWASLFVQTLDATSNTSKFIVKRVLGSMAIMSDEPINVGRLISGNIKAMDNAK